MLPHRAAAPLEVPHQLPHFRVTGRKEFLCSPAARAPLPGAQPYRAELLVTEHQAQERHFPRKPDQSVWWWPKKPHSAHRVPPGPSRRFCLRENEASIGRARPGQHTPWASWSALLTTPTRQRVTCWGWQHGRSPGGGGREVPGGSEPGSCRAARRGAPEACLWEGARSSTAASRPLSSAARAEARPQASSAQEHEGEWKLQRGGGWSAVCPRLQEEPRQDPCLRGPLWGTLFCAHTPFPTHTHTHTLHAHVHVHT